MPSDPANRLDQAKPITIGSNRTRFTDRIGGADQHFYRLRFKQRSALELQLKGLRSNADVELVQDRNRNGEVDLGEVVGSSRAPDRRAESIQIQGLDAGTYFVRVFPKTDRTTRYQLMLSAQSTSRTSFAYEVVKRTNEIRRSRGLPALAVNTQLSQAAQAYAKHMATQDFFSHTGADGSTWQERILATGYNFSDAAENLAIGHSSTSSVINGWMNSPGHRDNMLAYQVQEIGAGYFYLARDEGRVASNHYWAQSFGTPAGARSMEDPFERDFPNRHIEEFYDKLDD